MPHVYLRKRVADKSLHRVQAFPGQSRGSLWKWALHVRCHQKVVQLRTGFLDISHMDGRTYVKAVWAKGQQAPLSTNRGALGICGVLIIFRAPCDLALSVTGQLALLYLDLPQELDWWP